MSGRERMARMLEHAPDECEECGGPNLSVVRFTGGNHRPRYYRESGTVRCLWCGHEMSWTHEVGEPEEADR